MWLESDIDGVTPSSNTSPCAALKAGWHTAYREIDESLNQAIVAYRKGNRDEVMRLLQQAQFSGFKNSGM